MLIFTLISKVKEIKTAVLEILKKKILVVHISKARQPPIYVGN